jgi:hypothetical protein
MSATTATRLGAASGIAFVVALMSMTSTGSETAVALAGETLALLLLVPFLVHLWSVLRSRDGAGEWLPVVALCAGLLAVVIKVFSVIPTAVARLDDPNPAIGDSLERVGEVAFIVTLQPLGLCLAAVAAVVLRTGALPAWLGWTAAATSPLLIVNGFALESENGPAFLLFLLWTLLASIVLLRRAMAPAPAVAHAT